MKTDAFDEVDRQLVHALQIDGRAPFARIAAVLGVSDQTVARRYTRLRTRGLVRVLGLTDTTALGEVEWSLRVQCRPDAALSVAEALARRADTSWVSLMTGGTEIAVVVRSRSGQDGDELLLRELPRTPQVVGVTAQCLLHQFFGGQQGLVNKSGALSEGQVERLRTEEGGGPPSPGGGQAGPVAGRPAEASAPVVLSEADERLLGVLEIDGRAPLAELAAATNWSQSTVRRRLAELRQQGVLFFDVDYDMRMFGLVTRAALWMSVSPAELHETGERIAEHPEVACCFAITGQHNLFAMVSCTDVPALYRYLTTRIAALPAIRLLETSPMIRRVKGPGPVLAGASPRRRR
ncbi:Lrp/AsnC family transcriptional regulator [Streptomyces buecherae]